MKLFKIIFCVAFLCCFFFRNIYSQVKTDEILIRAKSSDVIIIGTVENIVDTPAPKSEMFHSMMRIEVDSLLKGTINFQEIIIKLQGVPITDGVQKGTRIALPHEPVLTINQQYMFFLKKLENSSYLNSPFVKKTYKSFSNKKSISELDSNIFWVDNRHVFKIENNKVFYFDTKVEDFINIIGY